MLARLAFRKARPAFHAVAAGDETAYELDLEGEPDAAVELAIFAASRPPHSAETRRLRLALEPASRDRLLDLLAARRSSLRRLAAKLCGSLELEEAVPWLELRLSDRNHLVRDSAARALGRIGGARAADALLRALPRERVPWYRLTVELAKAAPSLHLESALGEPAWHEQRPALMVALALRRPELTAADFLALAPPSGPRDLIAACHVLARSGGAAQWIAALLDHPDRRVRAAADRALGRLRHSRARPVYLVAGTDAS